MGPPSSPRQVPIPAYVSTRSANALISELRPVTLLPDALLHLNLVLDELLAALVAAAQSVAPTDIKTKGIGKVFADVAVISSPSTTGTPERSPLLPSFPRDKPRTPSSARSKRRTPHFHSVATSLQVTQDGAALALGREAVNEAELELKAWRDANPGNDGYLRDPRGLKDGREGAFPVVQAVDMLRCRIMAYSTLGKDQPDTETAQWLTDLWVQAGGSAADDVVAPAALYMTAIIEHVSERILTGIGRVLARNTSPTAGLYDLYSALCEDEALWGFFKRLSVKHAIEDTLRITPTSEAYNLGRTTTTDSHTSSILHVGPEHEAVATTPSGGIRGPSLDLAGTGGRKQSISRRTPSIDSLRPASSPGVRRRSSLGLQRASSVLSRGAEAGRGVTVGEDRTGTDDAFDALVASGETLRVTLTPSRLKKFDTARFQKLTPAEGTAMGGGSSGPPLGRKASTSSSRSVGKLVPRDEPAPRRDATLQDGRGSHDEPRGETLKDVLLSDPPWAVQAGARGHTVLPVERRGSTGLPVLGPPIRSSTAGMTPREPTPRITSSPKLRSETAELTEFLLNTPPPAGNNSLQAADRHPVESPSRLKSLVNRVTGGMNGLGLEAPLGRRSSATSQSKLQRAAGKSEDRGGHSQVNGLFSSRDQHIEDEFIGPSTIGSSRLPGQQGILRPMVEVGSIRSGEGASLGEMDLSSPASVNPDDPGRAVQSTGASEMPSVEELSVHANQTRAKSNELSNGKTGVEEIPVEEILRLREDMKGIDVASECRILVDELLRRHGVGT